MGKPNDEDKLPELLKDEDVQIVVVAPTELPPTKLSQETSAQPEMGIAGLLPVYDAPPGPILVTEQEELIWIKVGVAVDSGACAHVTPASVFAMESVLSTGPTFYAANGAPIKNYGTQEVNAILDDETKINLKFNVAEIARPLLSVFEINSKGFVCVFGQDYAYLESTKDGSQIPLRLDNKLYMLDMWLQVPKSMTDNGHFGGRA